MKKRVAVLGATGSIGQSALDVLRRDPNNFEVVLLSAHSREEELKQLQTIYPSSLCVLTNKINYNEDAKEKLRKICPDITINGISGAAGFEYSIAAIDAGSTLALANKETIVMAGEYIFNLAKEKSVKIIPVDSEHSAIFHLLEGFNKLRSKKSFTEELYINHSLTPCSAESSVVELILTASGGPFRNFTIRQLENVNLQDALAHPTWNMGQKITIDSASMANKGLEIIEACALFKIPCDKIKVVIHPQSIVHSMVRLSNGTVYAQLSKPDMRNPIADALYWPEISPPVVEPLNFENLTLEFTKPDTTGFPMLSLAYEAARRQGLYPCAYNAANEEAVQAFTLEKCSFTDIPKITENVLQKDWSGNCSCVNTILNADKKARKEAANFIKNMG